MPALDRRIVVNVEGPETRNQFGETVPGVITPYGVWAQRRDAGSSDIDTTGGVVVQSRVEWNIRYRDDFNSMEVATLSVLDGLETYDIETVTESDDRRRMLTLTGVSSV